LTFNLDQQTVYDIYIIYNVTQKGNPFHISCRYAILSIFGMKTHEPATSQYTF